VLSHNEIEEMKGLSNLSKLTKLSLSHNKIRELPSLEVHRELQELRLSDNHIQTIPESITFNQGLKIVDFAKNMISSWRYNLSPSDHTLIISTLNNPLC